MMAKLGLEVPPSEVDASMDDSKEALAAMGRTGTMSLFSPNTNVSKNSKFAGGSKLSSKE